MDKGMLNDELVVQHSFFFTHQQMIDRKMKIRPIATLSALIVMAAMAWGQGTTVSTKSGKLQGVASAQEGITVFRGVPYACPPVGRLRWKPAQPVRPWKGVRRADTWGNISWQAEAQPGTFYWKEFYQEKQPTRGEDCLYLNIWVPTSALGHTDSKLPVAFWVHGGAFRGGNGHEITMDGDAWAQRGVILVTINYRLGVLGFLSHPALTAESNDSTSGNYGLSDQIMALRWVYDNIAQFGGDPSNITVLGQSAGGASVKNLVASPLSRGMIRHCIIQSNNGLAKPTDNSNAQRDADNAGKQLMDKAGLTDLTKMRGAKAEDIVQLDATTVGRPHVDKVFLPEDFDQAATNCDIADIDYMIGCTVDDIRPMNKAIDRFCYQRDTTSSHHVYQYIFVRKLPGSRDGAFHSAELWYMFHTLNRSWRPFTQADYKLADQMMDYWTNFCKYGNPNGNAKETWHAFTQENPFVMTLNVE